MFCPNCGRALEDGAKFCDGCGESLLVQTTGNQSTIIKEGYSQNNVHNYNPPVQKEYYQPTSFYQNPQSISSGPLSIGNYLVMMILAGIPIVGFILLLVWSFSSNQNPNKKNWARATLIMGVIVFIIMILFSSVLGAIFSKMMYR